MDMRIQFKRLKLINNYTWWCKNIVFSEPFSFFSIQNSYKMCSSRRNKLDSNSENIYDAYIYIKASFRYHYNWILKQNKN